NHTELIPIPLDTLRAAYDELGRLVHVALRTQQGDAACLGERQDDCLQLLQLTQQHMNIFPLEEYCTLQESVRQMIQCLDEATQQSLDPPDHAFGPTTHQVPSELSGQPRINIDPALLSVALDLCGPTHLANIFGCHLRTIRRWALELGIVEPGHPVYIDYENEDGTTMHIY
ncbi:hypothetical protein C0992_002128, partial [Termitomyces sp. T32_za158]